jgi:hypothetical protein
MCVYLHATHTHGFATLQHHFADYGLLEELTRVEDVARRCKPPGPRPELPPALAKLVYQAHRRHVTLLLMPPGAWAAVRGQGLGSCKIRSPITNRGTSSGPVVLGMFVCWRQDEWSDTTAMSILLSQCTVAK